MRDVTVVADARTDGERRECVSWRRHEGWRAAVVLLAALMAAGVCAARDQQEESGSLDGTPMQSGGMVWITLYDDAVVLDEEIVLPPQEDIPVQPALQGSLGFSVASPLPHWSVNAEFEPTAGPGGAIDLNRIMVRAPATEGEFVGIASGLIVASGNGPAPAPDLWLELQARPEWTDEPGLYHGLLHLTPVVVPEDHDSEIEYPGALRVVTGGSGSLASAFGPRVTVPVVMTIAPLTVVMTSETEFNIETSPGPGRYYVEPDLDVLVATNEEQWNLLLMGTPFVSETDEIPLERVEWAVLDAGGEPGAWTLVGDSNCLMSGYDERGVLSARFRLALEVIITDAAGEYICELHLVGSPQ